jgi:hypothetical protein
MSVQDQAAEPSGTSSQPRIYTELQTPRSIRLVSIDHDQTQSPVSCTLIETPLDKPISYLALSYAWGDPTATGQILCNNQPLQVTESLIAAMRQLRQRYPSVLFWIDALCINQSDLSERAAQVQLMRDIYHSASNVVIYLGETSPGLDRAMRLFRSLESSAAEWTPPPDDDVSRDNNTHGTRSSEIRSRFPPPYDEVWYRFHDFFNRAWFSRIWIVQEVVVASGDPDVICGEYALSWSSVAAVAEFVLYTGLSGSTTRKSKSSLVGLMQDLKGNPRALRYLLSMSTPFASSEPRDKVFALYGLVHRAEEDMLRSEYFRVDYQASVRDVFRDVMFGYVMHYGSLDLMSEAMEVADGEMSVRDLPSWVPDWSLPFTAKHFSVGRQAGPSGFDACGGRGTMVQGSMRAIDPDVLRVAGKVHDEVAWVSKPFDGPEHSPLPWHRRPFVLEKLWEDVRERLGCEPRTCHAFWRTLLANADKHGELVTDRLYPTFLRFWYNSKVHDRDAAQYIANNQDDLPLSEERERELFREHAMDYGMTLTEEDFHALQASKELLASQFLPCDSTPECKHCTIVNLPLPEGMRVTGPSPALAQRDTDPFLKDYQLVACDPEMDILIRMRQTLDTRTFIITKSGLMGLGPKHTRAGDAVAVLTGAKVPFVLRATGVYQTQREIGVGFRSIREYRVVGDAYVHGIMQGEAVRDVDWDGGGYEVLDLV